MNLKLRITEIAEDQKKFSLWEVLTNQRLKEILVRQ